jgi:hypothetical protein
MGTAVIWHDPADVNSESDQLLADLIVAADELCGAATPDVLRDRFDALAVATAAALARESATPSAERREQLADACEDGVPELLWTRFVERTAQLETWDGTCLPERDRVALCAARSAIALLAELVQHRPPLAARFVLETLDEALDHPAIVPPREVPPDVPAHHAWWFAPPTFGPFACNARMRSLLWRRADGAMPAAWRELVDAGFAWIGGAVMLQGLVREGDWDEDYDELEQRPIVLEPMLPRLGPFELATTVVMCARYLAIALRTRGVDRRVSGEIDEQGVASLALLALRDVAEPPSDPVVARFTVASDRGRGRRRRR